MTLIKSRASKKLVAPVTRAAIEVYHFLATFFSEGAERQLTLPIKTLTALYCVVRSLPKRDEIIHFSTHRLGYRCGRPLFWPPCTKRARSWKQSDHHIALGQRKSVKTILEGSARPTSWGGGYTRSLIKPNPPEWRSFLLLAKQNIFFCVAQANRFFRSSGSTFQFANKSFVLG